MTFSRTLVARSLAAALFATAVSTLPAQSVVTDPVGFTTLTIAAKPASSPGFTYLALNMFRPTAYRSVVVSASTVGGVTVLTFPANSFTTGQFTGTGNASFVEIAPGGLFANGSGPLGVLSDITANDTSTITLADNVTPLITGGTTAIKVRPHWTLGTVFGPTNSAGLQGSNTPLNADTVSVLNGTTGGFTVYFFSTTNNRWQNGPSDATNSVLRPDSGLLVQRKVTSAVSFTLVGEVKLGPTEIMIAGGNAAGNSTIVPNPYPLASLPLSQIGLYTGNATTGFVGSTTPLNADTLSVLNPATGGFTVYFYNTTNNRWQNGPSDASNVTIPEGAAVLITRKLGRAAFPWYVPQPSMNL